MGRTTDDLAIEPAPPGGTRTPAPRRLGTKRLAVLLAAFVVVDVAALALVVAFWSADDSGPERTSPITTRTTRDEAWEALDPSGRCAEAMRLVTYPNRWPTVCRWRTPPEPAGGLSFPPPAGEPPWDRPRIEIYLDPAQTRLQVAHSIAHELGHMQLTRQPTVTDAWLLARGLAPDTPWQVWVEDYAEAFAAVFGPPLAGWSAPTAAPSASDWAALKERFFSGSAVAGSG